MTAETGAILIVEDDENDARMLEHTLRETAVLNPIEVVHSAREAIAFLEQTFPYGAGEKYPVRIILLDLKLPGMDGFEFLDWLGRRVEFEDVLVVVVSGLDQLSEIRRAYALGADSFLTKPCRGLDVENLIQWFPGYWERPGIIPASANRETAHAS